MRTDSILPTIAQAQANFMPLGDRPSWPSLTRLLPSSLQAWRDAQAQVGTDTGLNHRRVVAAEGQPDRPSAFSHSQDYLAEVARRLLNPGATWFSRLAQSRSVVAPRSYPALRDRQSIHLAMLPTLCQPRIDGQLHGYQGSLWPVSWW